MKGKITQELANGMIPRTRDFFVWDSVLPGFGLKVTPTGKRIYVFQYRLGGRLAPTKRITIGGDAAGWTVRKARARAKEFAAAQAEGHEVSLANVAPETRPPVEPTADVHLGPWQIRLGFLAGDIARLQNTLLRRSMKRLRASHTQWRMLGQLALNQGVTQMELAKILGLSKVAVTGLVRRVVRAGWVEQRLDERDRRVRRLFLTRQAKKAVSAMREEVDIMFSQAMGHIPDAHGEEMVVVFEGIKEKLLDLGQQVRRRKIDDES